MPKLLKTESPKNAILSIIAAAASLLSFVSINTFVPTITESK
ncbi:hypothetical protein L539_3490 [Bordetella hinzii 5132]|nr:hypothetical protein L539_3490 [Bordetella hinzii 5132]